MLFDLHCTWLVVEAARTNALSQIYGIVRVILILPNVSPSDRKDYSHRSKNIDIADKVVCLQGTKWSTRVLPKIALTILGQYPLVRALLIINGMELANKISLSNLGRWS